MRQYSADQNDISWLGVDLKEGAANGSYLTEARDQGSWTVVPSAGKKVTRVYNPGRSGTLSYVCDQTSETMQRLKAIAAADRNAGTRTQVGPLTSNDASSGEVVTWKNAFIMTEPDYSRGNEAATFTWVFGFEDVDHAPAAALTNAVGN